jgi:hypothetical protein
MTLRGNTNLGRTARPVHHVIGSAAPVHGGAADSY